MGEIRLFENTGVLKEIFISEIVWFLVCIAGIFILKSVFLRVLKTKFRQENFQIRTFPLIEDVVNSLVFYGVILFFLNYFWTESWLTDPFYETEGVEISLLLIVIAIMIVTLANRAVKAVNRYIMPFVYEQFGLEMGMRYTLNRIIYYSVMFLALIVSFTTAGLDLTAVGVIFSVLGIGIGFGMRNIAANFVSGIIILFERPMEVGELVEIDKKIGRISKIKLRSTVVETLKDGTLVVPNQYFIEQIVKNRSSAQLFARVIVSVAYGSDTREVERLLLEAAEQEIDRTVGVPVEQPDVQFIDFRNSALDFQVEVRVVDVETKEKVESLLRHGIARLFTENEVKLADNWNKRDEG
ncbi:mechanosensitive ion channel family protein [Indiicoccus explosivorum]|uniref:mechanosensitive ion channel family protein n=1 Tax=Indiicoccus explosivorum TaxID=1917864 RepID=UPI000B45000E|nr:mechanosensitive ion channel domain-containing protein [Indiicoccus explosivorum]